MIHFTWSGVRTMPSCIVLVCWATTATQPGSGFTQNSNLRPLTQLQYQLSLINKAYSCMARKLVILAISYPRQISQSAVHRLPIHTAEKDITFTCFNVLCHPLWKCYFSIIYTGEEAGNQVKAFFFFLFFQSVFSLTKNWIKCCFCFLQNSKHSRKKCIDSHTLLSSCVLFHFNSVSLLQLWESYL